MATYNGNLIENYVPCVKYGGGIRTNLDVSVGDGATVTLPSTTTIGGSSVVALGNITSSSTTATAFSVTNTGIFTGTSVTATIADSLTTGTASLTTTNGQTSGHNTVISSTGTIVTTGDLLSVTGNSATTSTGLVRISATGMTTGSTVLVTGGGANMTSAGKVLEIAMGAATAGNGISVTSTGVYTTGSTGLINVTANSATTSTGLVQISGTGLTSGVALSVTGGGANMTSSCIVGSFNMGAATAGVGVSVISTGVYSGSSGIFQINANSATNGFISVLSANGLTSGQLLRLTATAATLTTGFYIAANDGALNVFTVGANGHITSNQTTAPTATTNATGISAIAVTAGSSDVCGTLTTTGTPASGTVLTITFNKTYTTAPKYVSVSPANAASGGVNTMPIVTQTATTFVLTWPAGGVYAATPSYTYLVVA